MNIIDEIGEVGQRLHYLQERFIQKRGWKAKCDFPDACWRWEKEMNGRVFVMSFTEAYSLEAYLEEMEQDKIAAAKEKKNVGVGANVG